jgi:hypothetical protein
MNLSLRKFVGGTDERRSAPAVMKRFVGRLAMAAVLAALLASCSTAQATLLAGWDFQTAPGTAVAASPNTPKVYSANVGSGTLYLDGTDGSSNWLQASELNAFTGSNVNATNGLSSTTTSPAALAVLGGTGTSPNFAANGKSMVFKFDMTGLEDLSVTFSAQRSNTGFNSQVWETSTDASTWSSWGSFVGGSTAGTIRDTYANTGVLSLATTSALDNAASAYVRVTFTGATSAAGNNRLDNFQFDAVAVPEPSTLGLAAAGVALAGLGAWKRRRAGSPVQAG